MNDALPVGHVHGPHQELDEPGRFVGGLRFARQAPRQAAAFDELQREEGQAVVFADLEDLHHVGVLQARQRGRLGAEAVEKGRQLLRAADEPCLDHLEGDEAVQGEVAGLVDDAHSAPAPFAKDLVARDRRQARREGRNGRRDRRFAEGAVDRRARVGGAGSVAGAVLRAGGEDGVRHGALLKARRGQHHPSW